MTSDHPEAQAVLEANQRFYEAFGSLDIDRMDQVWEHSDRVLCTHPGWPVLLGWERVRQSWANIFNNTSLMHFNVTNATVVIEGGAAWVNCIENISSVVDARASNFGVQATNIFARGPDGWRMVHHHTSG